MKLHDLAILSDRLLSRFLWGDKQFISSLTVDCVDVTLVDVFSCLNSVIKLSPLCPT